MLEIDRQITQRQRMLFAVIEMADREAATPSVGSKVAATGLSRLPGSKGKRKGLSLLLRRMVVVPIVVIAALILAANSGKYSRCSPQESENPLHAFTRKLKGYPAESVGCCRPLGHS